MTHPMTPEETKDYFPDTFRGDEAQTSLPNLVESEQPSADSLPHTPVPWMVETEPWYGAVKTRLLITAFPQRSIPTRYVVCSDDMGIRREQAEVNYEFIVRACNSHDDLLKACQMLIAAVESGGGIGDVLPAIGGAATEARKAIAKATGKD